jgi:acyl-CoA reductase-like NAD-dependent aldehyde dehydrogenase
LSTGRQRRYIVGVLLTVASLAALAFSVWSGWGYRGYVRCQAEYNEVIAERTRILTEVGAAERQAERRRDDLLDATFLELRPDGETSPEDRARLLEKWAEYLEAARDLKVERAAADKARAANPQPPPPSSLCG